jgi:hypothetical protein
MSRPFLDPNKVRRQGTTVSLLGDQPIELRKRGGSAYLRLVLSTPVRPEHRVVKVKKK